MSNKAHLVADLLRTVIGSERRKQPTAAIIAAGGSSSRMGNAGGITKQHMTIDGIPVIVHTLLAFEACEDIDEIIVVAREDEIPRYNEYKKRYEITKLTRTVGGGKTRQESVLKGFEAIDSKIKFVAIHDGARCLVTPEIISSVCREAYRYKAAIAATAVRDTVKIADDKGFIAETTDRNYVWLAQTPQIISVPLYTAAAYNATHQNIEVTDDAMLVESIENPVRLVECGRENIKITTPDDIILAEHILKNRQKN